MNAIAFFNNRIEERIAADRAKSLEHGWEFKERTTANHTIGDFVNAVFHVLNGGDARLFYDGYLEWMNLRDPAKRSGQPATEVCRANIGWCFGEGMAPEKIKMWIQVCDASHPIFGQTKPSHEMAFELGVEQGKAMRK